MVFCGEKGFGGEDEVELLREPWWKGLLERLDGLVLLGLGPPAILSCDAAEWRRGGGGQRSCDQGESRLAKRTNATGNGEDARRVRFHGGGFWKAGDAALGELGGSDGQTSAKRRYAMAAVVLSAGGQLARVVEVSLGRGAMHGQMQWERVLRACAQPPGGMQLSELRAECRSSAPAATGGR